MKYLSALLVTAAGIALVAPAATAKTSVRQAEKTCIAAAKEQASIKSAKSSDDGQRFTNASAEIPLRITHEDGTRSRMICTVDRNSGEVTALEAAE